MPCPPEQETAAVAALIARYPLAWVVSRAFNASVLPLLAEHDAAGQLTAVIGHCMRTNPLVADFERDAAGLILFNGPDSYVATDCVSHADWAPTWNFAVLRLQVEIEWLPDETAGFIDRLLDRLEGPLPGRWSVGALGDRYRQMVSRVIGFRAHLRSVRPHFKLGQDESPDTFREIVDNVPDRTLAAWMDAFAKGGVPSPIIEE